MTRSNLATIREQLTEVDWAILRDVATYRLLTSKQLQRLHFDSARPSPLAAARACTRALTKLRGLGILRALERRIGGVRAGSAGYVWHLADAGDRLLLLEGSAAGSGGERRNYREPSRHFVSHTLAVAELAVQAIELTRVSDLDIVSLQPEPASWQASLTPSGTVGTLKPDLRLVLAAGDYEDHWFVEADLATEHQPVIRRQCRAYMTYLATGRYQNEHGTFPRVAWIVPDQWREAQLRDWIHRDPQLDTELFTVATTAQFQDLLRGSDAQANHAGGRKGEAP